MRTDGPFLFSSNHFRTIARPLGIAILLGLMSSLLLWQAALALSARTPAGARAAAEAEFVEALEQGQERQAVPPNVLDSATDWINTSDRIRLSQLKGKIVLLDFWTFCCINCHHVIPDLEYLEKKYANQLVVIGIHTPKFDAEKRTENIRKKVDEYRIKHPVANDSDKAIWEAFGVSSWPTLVLIDANGRYVGQQGGEGNRELFDRIIGRLVEDHRKRKELNEDEPYVFRPESEKPRDTVLNYPGKVLADGPGNRLFISDTGHNRIVITDFKGQQLDVIGDGGASLKDGTFDVANFNRQQGMCLLGDILYIADVENHAIRAADLKARTVTTIAGDGQQTYHYTGPKEGSAKKFGLNSPWDIVVAPNGKSLIIAMAGPHQIWKLDLERGRIEIWAGSGRENILDGSLAAAQFAQPSGLATDGQNIYVADSEVSGLRKIDVKGGRVTTLIGSGLFDFGDIDGPFARARLQHCLGVAYDNGQLYVADSYNDKIKVCDLKARTIRTLAGGIHGSSDDPPKFYEPGGISVAGRTLFVADTNNSLIRAIDLDTNKVSTLALKGVKPPAAKRNPPSFPLAKTIAVPPVTIKPGSSVKLNVAIALPPGYQLGPEAPMPFVVDAPNAPGALAATVTPLGSEVAPPSTSFTVDVPLAKPAAAGSKLNLKLSVAAFICQKEQGFCRPKSYIFQIPIAFAADGSAAVELQAGP